MVHYPSQHDLASDDDRLGVGVPFEMDGRTLVAIEIDQSIDGNRLSLCVALSVIQVKTLAAQLLASIEGKGSQ